MGSGCRSGIDSKGGKREGGFSDRSSRNLLGELRDGSEDEGEKDSGGEEIGSGDLLFASSIRCPSRVGEFDRAAEGFGFGEVEKKKIWKGDGERDWLQSGEWQIEVEGFGQSDDPTSLPATTESGGKLRRVGGPGGSDRGWAKNLSEDWNCDGWVWGPRSGGEGGVGYVDHGRGRLSYGSEGEGVRHQSNFRWASGDGGVWGERSLRKNRLARIV